MPDHAATHGSAERAVNIRVPGSGRLAKSVVISAVALALYGLIRFTFNSVGLRVFGPAFLGAANAAISTLTVAAVLASAAPALLANKFIAEHLGAERRDSALRVFSGTLLINALITAVCSVGFLCVQDLRPTPMALVIYLPAFAFYIFFKNTYFALQLNRQYFHAEMLACVSFFLVFAASCALGLPTLALVAFVLHPTVFVSKALLDHRRFYTRPTHRGAFAWHGGRYITFFVSTLVYALSGLGSFHLVVVLAALLLDSKSEVGYLSALMAALTPLSLVPTAVGTVLFPELARLFGAKDEPGQRQLLLTSTAVLLCSSAAIIALALFPSPIFRILGIPETTEFVLIWEMICVDSFFGIAGSSSALYLNASAFVHQQAVLSALFVALGIAVGMPAIQSMGVVGAGLMRFVTMVPFSCMKLWLANRYIRFLSGRGTRFVTALGFVASCGLAGVLSIPLTARLAWATCALGAIAYFAIPVLFLRPRAVALSARSLGQTEADR